MHEQSSFGDDPERDQGIFEISEFESRTERWRQIWLLTLGLAGLWLGHEVATWAGDPTATSVRLWTAAVVLFGVVEVGRAITHFVNSVSTHQARVFRCRHLALCGAGLLAIAGTLVASLLAWGPLRNLLSHGRVTGSDIADVGFVVVAGWCLVGAITAFMAAVAEFRSEQSWRLGSTGHSG